MRSKDTILLEQAYELVQEISVERGLDAINSLKGSELPSSPGLSPYNQQRVERVGDKLGQKMENSSENFTVQINGKNNILQITQASIDPDKVQGTVKLICRGVIKPTGSGIPTQCTVFIQKQQRIDKTKNTFVTVSTPSSGPQQVGFPSRQDVSKLLSKINQLVPNSGISMQDATTFNILAA